MQKEAKNAQFVPPAVCTEGAAILICKFEVEVPKFGVFADRKEVFADFVKSF